MTGGTLQGAYFGESGEATVEACVGGLIGAVMKENAADREVPKEYGETVERALMTSDGYAANTWAIGWSLGNTDVPLALFRPFEFLKKAMHVVHPADGARDRVED